MKQTRADVTADPGSRPTGGCLHGVARYQLLLGGLRRRCGLLVEFRLYKRGAARDVGHDARTAGNDVIEACQPLRAFKLDGRADSWSNLADVLRKSLGQEEPLRELGHAGKVFLTKLANVVDPGQEPVVARPRGIDR